MSLDRLLGSWAFTMDHSERAEPVIGRQRYERILGGAFVMLDWTYEHPDFPDAIAILDQSTYSYFDVRGVIRVFEFVIDDGGWSMIRLESDFSQRTAGKFGDADTIDCVGERSADGGSTWQRDFTMRMTRVE